MAFRVLVTDPKIDDLALFDIVEEAEEGWAMLMKRGLKAHSPPSLPGA